MMRYAAIGTAVLLGACGGANYSSESPGGYNSSADAGAYQRQCYGANDCYPGQYCNSFGACVNVDPGGGGVTGADMGTLPPEVQNKVEPPASGKRFVYVTVPAESTVVKIDSQSLQVRTVSVGKNPGPLRTVPNQDVAVVLSRGSDSLTLMRSKNDGSDTVTSYATAPGENSLAMSPDGRYALAWFDLSASGGVLSPKQTFQEVTLLHLEAGLEAAINLSVGFRPSDVQFAPDGSACWVVTDQGVSAIPLQVQPKPSIVPTVPLVRDPLVDAIPDNVRFTRDGKLAVAHVPALRGFRVVDLGSGAITDVPLDGEPSDVEVTPDGSLAVAVLRDQNEVAFVRLPADVVDPSGIIKVTTQGYVAGQAVITHDSQHALLFTNASNQKVILVADLAQRTIKVLPLKKAIRSVELAPDGKAALVIHNKVPGTPGPNDTLEQYLDKLQAYSILDVQGGYAKLQPTDAMPGPVAFAPDSQSAYLLLSDVSAGVRSVEALDLVSFLVTRVDLGSPPVAVGVVPSTSQIYVAQTHPLGRMTFVDTSTFRTRTLTGFALNGGIIE